MRGAAMFQSCWCGLAGGAQSLETNRFPADRSSNQKRGFTSFCTRPRARRQLERPFGRFTACASRASLRRPRPASRHIEFERGGMKFTVELVGDFHVKVELEVEESIGHLDARSRCLGLRGAHPGDRFRLLADGRSQTNRAARPRKREKRVLPRCPASPRSVSRPSRSRA